MIGETNLQTLLKNMKPVLNDGVYVFCNRPLTEPFPSDCNPAGIFKEQEGWTVILLMDEADRLGWSYEFLAAWITLQVHSDLAAVGLTAAIATALAAEGISCNVVAGYYHDHLFVALDDAHRALDVLQSLSQHPER